MSDAQPGLARLPAERRAVVAGGERIHDDAYLLAPSTLSRDFSTELVTVYQDAPAT